MTGKKPRNEAKVLEEALAGQSRAERYLLRLYVTGTTPRSVKAIRNIRAVCEEKLHGRYDLEVIDIYQQPELASRAQIVVAPTLIKRLPLPVRRLIGDLSKLERVLVGLDLVPRQPLGGDLAP
jgi:circadian clock protein KaiB